MELIDHKLCQLLIHMQHISLSESDIPKDIHMKIR
jgi:hypothetical protein